jgi:Flp pilus assembly protein TadD
MDTLHDIGVAYTALRQFAPAEKYLRQALQIEPKTPRVLQALGVLRLQQHRLAEAARYFGETLALDPGSAEAKAALQHA